jgi:phage terminase large subunit-like protein
MGMRGVAAHVRRTAREILAGRRKRALPWKRKGLSRVERVLRFLEFLPITKGRLQGKPLRLLPNQRRFVETIYSPADVPVRLAVKSEPRGNGKTGLIAGLALCHLLGPEAEPRGEVYSAAKDRAQAALIYHEMEAIILAVPEFAERVNLQRFSKRIEVLDGDGEGSTYEALSADARRAHGISPTFWAYDELAQARDRELLDNLQTAMGKRAWSLGVIISTQAASDEHPLSEIIDDGIAGHDASVRVQLLAAPHDADPFAPETIRAVNPAFGTFLDESVVLQEAERARRLPSNESAFRNLRLNQRIGTHARDLFLSAQAFASGAAPIDEALFQDGRPVYGGLDLSGQLDLTAAVFAVEDDAGVVHLKSIAWTPAATVAERVHIDRAPYDAWVRTGALRAVPGKVIDYEFVAVELAMICNAMHLQRLYYDRWRIELLRKELAAIGVILPLMPCGQGFQDMAPCLEAFEALVAAGRIRHGNDPVLRWSFSNAIAVRDPAGNRKLSKSKSYGRIDPAVASVMAAGAMKACATPMVELKALIA